ncbi:uncharacterized protein B0H18DRAFT_959964 [Fomitopsis serialis]|uniref:uncharacterized protein n=1 Tax=Fomitopsis serialis TaxID=139415 RepID=UPI002007B03E|nr:uncharacterized protein B0H18DRAFT_959964 [Neoantrodia serialis]KAH9914258.1 hypothetical protein B0H18DRAFT_959964 [Neoantrodia serialis]
MPATSYTPGELLILRSFLPEWKAGDSNDRKDVRSRAVEKLEAHRGKPLKKEGKKAVRAWFYNAAPVKNKKRKDRPAVFGRRLNWHRVVAWHMPAELDEKMAVTGVTHGDKDFLATYQKELRNLANSLPRAKQREYKQEAVRWNSEGQPHELQDRNIVRKSKAVMLDFANYVWRNFGMRVFVHAVYKSLEGKPCLIDFDCNDLVDPNAQRAAGRVKFKDMYPDYKRADGFRDLFKDYGHKLFAGEDLSEESDADVRASKRGVPKIDWEMYDDNTPCMPHHGAECFKNLRNKKAFISDFVRLHYVAYTNMPKLKVPWVALQATPEKLLEAGSLPDGVTLQEPSHLKQAEVDSLIAHWRTRANSSRLAFVMRFIAYRNHQSEIVSLEHEEPRTASRRAARSARRARASVTPAKDSDASDGDDERDNQPGHQSDEAHSEEDIANQHDSSDKESSSSSSTCQSSSSSTGSDPATPPPPPHEQERSAALSSPGAAPSPLANLQSELDIDMLTSGAISSSGDTAECEATNGACQVDIGSRYRAHEQSTPSGQPRAAVGFALSATAGGAPTASGG